MFKYFSANNFDLKNKVVGIRVDINSPIISKRVAMNERIKSSALSIKDLVSRGAKVVVLAHQGRKGKSDCVSLKEHSVFLEKELGRNVDFIDEIYSEKVIDKINNMKSGDVLLLENLRFYDDEATPNKKGNIILKLESVFDFYVFDAFSVSHRKQSSVVGFKKIPNIAGKLLEKEIMGLSEIAEAKKPTIYVFGGAKPDDLLPLIETGLSSGKTDLVLLSGVIGEVGLYVKGYDLGRKVEFLQEHSYLDVAPKLNELLGKYPDKIILPIDVAIMEGAHRKEIRVQNLEKSKDLIDKFFIQDIGIDTAKYYSLLMKTAGSIYFKGPAGNFEVEGFDIGTRKLFKGITSSGAFTFMGGGHSVTSAKNFGFLDKFSYVSLAGGALVKFLNGEVLPGIANLEESYSKYEKVYEDYVVVGSNTVDIGLDVPKSCKDVSIGDKIKINNNFKTTVGGGGVNVSICLSRLGGKVGYLGKLSYETMETIKEVLDKNKINLIESKISKRPGAKSILIDTIEKDRVIFTYRGQNSYLEESDFDINSFRSNNYYFTSLSGTSFKTLIAIAKKIKKRNSEAIICYNPSSYLIRNEKSIMSLIKYSDILILNYEEAQMLVSGKDVSDCLKKLFEKVTKVVVVTDGKNGAYAYDGKRQYHQDAFDVKKVVDATGAGDSFAGTFFYFYTKGYGVRIAMKYAAKNAASVVSTKGAQDGLLYLEDVKN